MGSFDNRLTSQVDFKYFSSTHDIVWLCQLWGSYKYININICGQCTTDELNTKYNIILHTKYNINMFFKCIKAQHWRRKYEMISFTKWQYIQIY